MDKTNKFALVTGASSGIGWHISKELAQRGYSLFAVSNQHQELQKLKTELEKEYGISVETLNINLAQKEAAQQIYRFCIEKALKVEVLVNNAGMMIFGELVQTQIKSAEEILQLHMSTPVLLCRLFGEEMKQRNSGYILNVSSISAVIPYPTIALYGPSKTFLRKFSKALRTEMRPLGVNVTCLIPGATVTSLFDTSKINLKLGLRLGVFKQPDFVAKAGVDALFRKKGEQIPGIFNKLVVIFVPLVPQFVIDLLYKRYRRYSSKIS
jgi:short-subunit dehydrogenase